MKALADKVSDCIPGLTAFAVGAGEIMEVVQMAMIAQLPYTAVRDAVITHLTLTEGLIALFSAALAAHSQRGC